MTTGFLFLLGLALLLVGGELLVRGATRLAAAAGIPPVIVGLTIVAFATSAPELAVSVQAAFSGEADLVVGNVVGSNIANLLLILGLSAAIAPLVVAQKLVRVDVPLMVGVSALVGWMALDGRINRVEGALLFAGLIAYNLAAIRASRATRPAVEAQYEAFYGEAEAVAERGRSPWLGSLSLLGLGIAGLILGARWLVDGATTAARALGVSELIIGLTIVAVGTSLPELVTSVLAAIRGERDIAAGNVIGSNIFNLLSVLGFTALLAPQGVPVPAAAIAFDLPVMLAASIACLPIFFVGNRISRWEGVLFLMYYAVYVAYLLLEAVERDAITTFRSAVLWFVIPLSVITLLLIWYRQIRERDRTPA